VILNSVDGAYFAVPDEAERKARRLALGIRDEELVVGVSAALRPEKNISQFVDAISNLVSKGIQVRGVIVGDGPLGNELREAVSNRGVENHILFVGAQKDVRPWLTVFDVGIICSTTIETLSLAALEIMAMGRPMIMSDIGGAAEIVRPGINGLMIPVGDLSALIAAIEELRDRKHCRRMGLEARKFVEAECTPQRMIDEYEEAFTRLNEI
jgi:glycosyltransferase involved in cell wall biosynthesis